MAVFKFQLNGEQYSIDLDAELDIINPETERSHVSALIAHWGILVAAAAANVERQESRLKSWEANAIAILLKQDEKVAEWKSKAIVHSDARYLQALDATTAVREVAAKIEAVYTAFVKKHDLLRSMSDRSRIENRSDPDLGRTHNDPRLDAFKEARRQAKKG